MLTIKRKDILVSDVPMSTSWLLSSCMEAKGRQDLWTKQKPEVLRMLKEQSMIQSAESSNRIEGVTITPSRLRPIVLGTVTPQDRSEEEIAGYKKSLDWIFDKKHSSEITSDIIKRLHEVAHGSSFGDAGLFKTRDNEIIEINREGEKRIRFIPASAKKTPQLIEDLCASYTELCKNQSFPDLLCVATFVFDFLCIHPFRDGNGRVSRLLTTFLLLQQDFSVSRYISLERLVEESKEDYYRVLKQCSDGWHNGENDIIPWWNYFLSIIKSAYKDLSNEVESYKGRPVKSELIRQAILSQITPFTLAEISALLPSVSAQMIKKILSNMKDENLITLDGVGRGALWKKNKSRN